MRSKNVQALRIAEFDVERDNFANVGMFSKSHLINIFDESVDKWASGSEHLHKCF